MVAILTDGVITKGVVVVEAVTQIEEGLTACSSNSWLTQELNYLLENVSENTR